MMKPQVQNGTGGPETSVGLMETRLAMSSLAGGRHPGASTPANASVGTVEAKMKRRLLWLTVLPLSAALAALLVLAVAFLAFAAAPWWLRLDRPADPIVSKRDSPGSAHRGAIQRRVRDKS
jgi:hypothetical protein